MTQIAELATCGQQVEQTQKATPIALMNLPHARQQVAQAAEAVTVSAGRIQDHLLEVWKALLPVKREDMPNDKVWADLVAIKNRMVFYNPAQQKPNKMKASLSLMRDDHAGILKEMICRLNADLGATV
jgi:hypothetical protein